MAGKAELQMQGKVYAAFLLAHDDYAAKPLMAGMVKLDPREGVSYKRLEAAAELNGVHFWTTKIVLEDQQLPMQTVEACYKLWVEERRSRFEKKTKKSMSVDVPCLKPIVSGMTFIEGAVSIGILTPETAHRCRLLKCPSASSLLPPGALPALDEQAGNSPPPPAEQEEQVEEGMTPATPILPGDENGTASAHPGFEAVTQPFQLAVDQIGLDGAEVTIVGEGPEVEDQQQDKEGAESKRDLDREVEDALLLAETLSEDEKSNLVYTKLVATVKRLQTSHKDQCKMIRSFNLLNLAQEKRLSSYQANSAEEIAAGLSPLLKKTLQDLKKEVKKEMMDELAEVKMLVKEEGRTGLVQELDGMKSSISTLNTKLAEVMKLGQSTMGAAALLNDNLKAVGIVRQEDPLTQVDIPKVLMQINSKLNDPEAASPALPLSTGVGLGAKNNPITSSSSMVNGNSPCLQKTSSSATPDPSKTPRKPSRLRGFLSSSETPAANKTLGLNQQAKLKPTARNISEQFDHPKERDVASPAGLMNDMLKAKDIWASPQPQHGLTQAQINQKLREMGAASVAQKRPRKD